MMYFLRNHLLDHMQLLKYRLISVLLTVSHCNHLICIHLCTLPPLLLTAETVLSITSSNSTVSEAAGMLFLSLVVTEHPPEQEINIRIRTDEILSNTPATEGMFHTSVCVCVCVSVCVCVCVCMCMCAS